MSDYQGATYPHFDPTSIIAGDFPLAARKVVIASGQNASGSPLAPGTLLGEQSAAGFAAAYAAKGGNTGNATLAFGSPATFADAMAGAYQVVFSSATAFTVYNPLGEELGTGANGAAFSDEIKFTTTAGGVAMVAGDTLLVTLTPQNYALSSAAGGSNVGNGTLALAATPSLAYVQPGAYLATFTSPTTFEVTDPAGNPVGAGAVGAAFAEQVGFTISAGGTAFAIGDSFTISVASTNLWIPSVATATDGSQIPGCVLAEYVDTSSAAQQANAWFTGEFTFEEMTVDASWTRDALNQAFASKGQSIFIRSGGLAA